MFPKKLTATLVIGSALMGLAGTALAAETSQDDIVQMFKMEMMDKNKDGMVSKKEFMDMMSKAWDMKAGEMKLKGGKMTTEEFDQWEKLLGTALRG